MAMRDWWPNSFDLAELRRQNLELAARIEAMQKRLAQLEEWRERIVLACDDDYR